MKPPLYLFNWPDAVGGAGTKVAHLLLLLHETFRVTVVPNEAARLTDAKWSGFIKRLGVEVRTRRELPRRLEGWGVSLCNGHFLRSGLAGEVKRRGLKLAWGSEMMWHHSGERALVQGGLIDLVLYTGEEQRAALLPGYTGGGVLPEPRGVVVGNYIHAPAFPYIERTRQELAAGRISRADPAKFPAGFPLTYHGLGLRRGRCRVLGWSPQVAAQWPWYDFANARITAEPPPEARASEWGFSQGAPRLPRPRWSLLAPGAVETVRFLHSLDLYVYDVGPGLRESWGRTVVEAMLTGLPVLLPADPRHHLHHLVPDKVAGFHCREPAQWREAAQRLSGDAALRRTMGRAGHRYAVHELCAAAAHQRVWREALG